MDFADRENQDSDFNESLDDGHSEPECQISGVESCAGAPGKVEADWVGWKANFNDACSDAPGGADGSEDKGGIADVGGKEDLAIEKENGSLNKGDDGKVKNAVDVDIL